MKNQYISHHSIRHYQNKAHIERSLAFNALIKFIAELPKKLFRSPPTANECGNNQQLAGCRQTT